MSTSNNPYSITTSPRWDESEGFEGGTATSQDLRLADNRVPDAIMKLLEKTRTWILFFSLLGFLLTALFAFVSAFMIFGGFITASSGTGFFVGSAVYVLAAVIVAIPSHFLWQLNYWIERASMQPTWRELEEVVRAQRVFWQVSGIMAALLIVLFVALALYAAFTL